MPVKDVPASVNELLARVSQSTANIALHRQAMVEVAAQVAASQQPTTPTGGEQK